MTLFGNDNEFHPSRSSRNHQEGGIFLADLFLNFAAILIISISVALLLNMTSKRVPTSTVSETPTVEFLVCPDAIIHKRSGQKISTEAFIGSTFENDLPLLLGTSKAVIVGLSKGSETGAFYLFSTLSKLGVVHAVARSEQCL